MSAVKNRDEGGEVPAVPLACTVCRERHLRCSGGNPCSRCEKDGQSCIYVQSRRGHRPQRKRQRSEEEAEKISDGYTTSNAGSDEYSNQGAYAPRLVTSAFPSALPETNAGSLGHNKLLELYYFYFHDAHPIMFPKAFLPRIPANAMPIVVEAAIDFVGAQYSAKARADPKYLHNLQACLHAKDAKHDAYMVQALTLQGIVYRAQDQNDLAVATFDQATTLALQLGMNRAAFAQLNSGGDAIIQEMWRRVWWELYVNELMLTAFRHEVYSRMNTVEMDVELPWEENEYRLCQPGITRSMVDYDQYTFFDDEEASFSSFAHRIIAARSIGRLLALNQPFCPESSELVTSIDIAINNWLLHLPEHKQTPLGKDGKLDEMMFQAHMMTNAASICLHRPRSDLVFTDVQDANNCIESRSYGAPASKFSVHTMKCTTAADKIAELITYPGDSLQHTPLFTCMLTLSAIVHLSAYLLAHGVGQRAAIRERLALSVGSLKSVKGTWMLADSVLQSIKGAAREVMTMGQQPTPSITSGSSDTYSTENPTPPHNPWTLTLHDPLFTQIPDLLPTDGKTLTSSAIPGPGGALPAGTAYA